MWICTVTNLFSSFQSLSNETGIVGYQVLYWSTASTVFQLVNTSLTNTTSLTDLVGGRNYRTAVRAVCEGGQTGPATRSNGTFSTTPRGVYCYNMQHGCGLLSAMHAVH